MIISGIRRIKNLRKQIISPFSTCDPAKRTAQYVMGYIYIYIYIVYQNQITATRTTIIRPNNELPAECCSTLLLSASSTVPSLPDAPVPVFDVPDAVVGLEELEVRLGARALEVARVVECLVEEAGAGMDQGSVTVLVGFAVPGALVTGLPKIVRVGPTSAGTVYVSCAPFGWVAMPM